MNNTTYDQIWECFINNCMVDKATLPQADEGKYILISEGCRYYNTLVDDTEVNLKTNNDLESINIKLDDKRILLLSYCMRYKFLENEKIRFEQVWQPLSRDIGIKSYRDQINSRQETLNETKREIGRLLSRMDNMSYLW